MDLLPSVFSDGERARNGSEESLFNQGTNLTHRGSTLMA